MTDDENAAYREKVEQANREGKTIQYKISDYWIDRHSPKNHPIYWAKNEYRIKPEPKFIPWTVQTIPKGEPLRFKDWNDGVCFIPTFYGSETVKHSWPNRDDSRVTYKELFDHFERLDGSPCGEDVEE